MNCSDAQALLSAYYDGELAAEMEMRMREHLGGCPACAATRSGFEQLSTAVTELHTPAPPESLWNQIQHELGEDRRTVGKVPWGWARPARAILAIAAVLLIALGIGLWTQVASMSEHGSMSAHFERYLEEFRRDPETAQQILLASYPGQTLDAEQAAGALGYRPAVADGLPTGYSVGSTLVMKMPCCTCVQTLCQRDDGSSLAIFEHDGETTTEWFGDRPQSKCQCSGKHCCTIAFDEQIAASWKCGKRYVTLIGVRDNAEVEKIVAWFDEKRRTNR
ncbi:MAG: anti-sigma factor [Planctomycetales bacterium]|nr:anti-sigma factor [Planctomycetales bacterium]